MRSWRPAKALARLARRRRPGLAAASMNGRSPTPPAWSAWIGICSTSPARFQLPPTPQTDFALNPDMLKSKFPFSKLVNKKVNTLIFPNLDAANITYKLLKELNKAESIGPIILGLDKPVHVFQLGASVEEMVNMAAVAVVDAQEKSRKLNK